MPRLLLVEDNELNRDMLVKRLTRRGYEILVAVNGRQGVDMAKAELPELILMDMSLPEIDGWEAARILKAEPTTADIPILALTAHAMEGDRERAIEAGCNDYDTKPIDLQRLIDKMTQLLGQRT